MHKTNNVEHTYQETKTLYTYLYQRSQETRKQVDGPHHTNHSLFFLLLKIFMNLIPVCLTLNNLLEPKMI